MPHIFSCDSNIYIITVNRLHVTCSLTFERGYVFMNKRMKKKLQKRGGFKTYKRYRYETLQHEIVSCLHEKFPDADMFMITMNETGKKLCGATVFYGVKPGSPESFEKIKGTIMDPNSTELPCHTDEYVKPVYESEIIRTLKKWRDTIRFDDPDDVTTIDSMGDLKE